MPAAKEAGRPSVLENVDVDELKVSAKKSSTNHPDFVGFRFYNEKSPFSIVKSKSNQNQSKLDKIKHIDS